MCNEEQTTSAPLASHLEFPSLLDTLPDAVIFLDATATIQYANARAATMVAAKQHELPGTTLWQCAPQLVTTTLYQAVLTATRMRQPLQVEYHSPVTQTWLHVRLSPTSQGVAAFFSEDTEPTRLQNTLRQSERRYQDLLERISDGVGILTPEGLVLEINQPPLTHAQVRREEVVGKPLTQTPWWSYAPATQEQLRAAIAQASRGETVRFEARICPPAGRFLDLTVAITPQFDANQQVESLIFIGRDITERKQAEDALHVLVDTIPQFVWIGRTDGYVEYHNQQWCNYTTMTSTQAEGNEWIQCLHPDDRQRTLDAWQTSVHAGTSYEMKYRLRNGTTGAYRWFLTRGMPHKDAQGMILHWVGTCTDISDRKHIEETLCQNQEQAHALLGSNMIGIFLAEGDEVVEANDTFLRMTGYSREDLHRRSMNWVGMTPPEYNTLTQQAHQELALHQYMMPYEKEYERKDGSRLPIVVCAVILQRNPLQIINFVLDNSAHRELEQRKDTFLSMANHELRTPLTALKLQIQLARARLFRQGLHEEAAALSRTEAPVKLLERLIGELLNGSKIQAGRLEYVQEPVDLRALLDEVAQTMQQISTTHTIVVRGSAPRTFMGDQDQLEHVFINLISNAIKYSPDATMVEVDISTAKEKTVTISVRDHGIGIPQEQREKIFERFYRAPDVSRRAIPGLGMGLYIVAEIVKQHRGTIMVECEMGKGSTFHVTLPLERQT
jgi:PAS domain S-box-containing protein